ncbi:hypothetical protein [Marinococcus luteus]|uniref:hypothetical protein n=1 Tax=Marinococcus luteus TaxID=1122204 RepID=UPI002ACC3CC3|nr:hypothetical protein [Marinococcus luteus]MDZ5782110.1 hypothetical protein [Marinococcus luteus]
MAKLTKDLLMGDAYTTTVKAVVSGQEVDVEIKPLNGPDSSRVEEWLQEGNTMKGRPGRNGKMQQEMSMDLKKNAKGQKESDILACAYGTVDSDFNEKFIREHWPNHLIKTVASEVKDLSGITNKAEIERFRNEQSGDSDGSGELVHSDLPSGDSAERADDDEPAAEAHSDSSV